MRREERTLVTAFESAVERFADRVAVSAPDSELTYQRLNEEASVLAGRLAKFGVGPGQAVTLLAPRTTGLVVGILGILKAGAAYVPVDPAYPSARVNWTIRDSKSPVVVSTAQAATVLGDPEADVLLLDQVPARTTGRQRCKATSRDVAYIIYTSGSAGEPKGVQVEHHSVLRLFETTRDWFEFDEDDVWSVFHSAAFDFSVWEIWGALLFGGRLVLVPQDVTRSPESFHELLRRQQVTILNQTPSAFRHLADADAASACRLDDLRLVVLGGDRLDVATLAPWMQRYGDERPRLVNMYGITEAVVHATYRPLTLADLSRDGPSPIGLPLPGMTFHLKDGQGAPAAPGTPGELFIEGPALARGYLARPELTAERFLTGQSADGPTRLLRTGDQLVVLPSGEYGYLGRVDDQLKIRGYRIEPGEIEAFLHRQPEVAQAAVIAHDYGNGDVRLIAYVVAATDAPDLSATLREQAAGHLPQHMRPSGYIVVDELPLTLNGKIDRARLRLQGPCGSAVQTRTSRT